MTDLPEGFLPLAHPSRWMNEDMFLLSLQHFKNQVVCSQENPILLTLGNHISDLLSAANVYTLEVSIPVAGCLKKIHY